ncbi:MAG: adenylosuccinate lyase [Anaerolineae bacterium]|nr:adenylosuccinate lyase [Candidatus Roseilinea sp.]MDW8451765.1 adenylosuccinate lyase [Anaerolineae bacterium]
MPSHITDSIFLKDLYGTDEMRAIFSDEALLQRWLDVEAALAQAEGEIGVIPRWAAEEIVRKARAELIDAAWMKREIDHTLHPIVPLIRALKTICDGDAGEYIHWGATTQDVMDTALVLQLKDAVALFEQRLHDLQSTLAELARCHRETIMPGRTHGQHALPITFGFKVAIWLDEFRRHTMRLRECKPRVLVGQFGGAVGTLAGVGEHGFEIRRRMMARLGLGVPAISWHVAHDGFAEFAGIVAMLAGTCGKIAHEVIALQKSEVMELEEPWAEGKVGSSTMPHKRNPMLCEAIVALARLCFDRARTALDGLIQEHERDWTVNHMEWAYLPELCVMADGALALTMRVLRGLRVYPERMRANVDALEGLMMSEAVMFALGQAMGRQTAHDVVYECAMRAVESKRPFREVLAEHPAVRAHLSMDDLARLLDPTRYLGLAREMVDRVCDADSE